MTPFPFDVVVFDLDGTLADTAPDLTDALNWMLVRLGRRALPLEKVLTMIGRGVRVLVEQGLAATGPLTPGLVETAVPLFFEHYELHLADRSLPYEGVEMSLDQLLTRGVRLAICTNKPERFARKLVDAFGWSKRFASIVGGDTLPFRKPDARPLLEAIKRCGGGKALFVGDSIVDIETARAASLPCLAVTFGFRDRPAAALGATQLIDRFDQLVPTLEKMI
ncbi:MAG: phosphoglycolate phosphatase [Chthoniobacterales bacterium]|nr:phosphoglycolate phosphatase [Chthoniobacterales bacterium]